VCVFRRLIFARGTPLVYTEGSSDISCGGLASSSGTTTSSSSDISTSSSGTTASSSGDISTSSSRATISSSTTVTSIGTAAPTQTRDATQQAAADSRAHQRTTTILAVCLTLAFAFIVAGCVAGYLRFRKRNRAKPESQLRPFDRTIESIPPTHKLATLSGPLSSNSSSHHDSSFLQNGQQTPGAFSPTSLHGTSGGTEVRSDVVIQHRDGGVVHEFPPPYLDRWTVEPSGNYL
jgi:hypothetical protein